MKMSVSWHKECLENATRTNDKVYDQIVELTRKHNEEARRLRFYYQQINRAEIEGRVFFDAERYGVKRNKKEIDA